MFKTILASAIVVLLGATGLALAADCSCTLSGERPCFVMINCMDEETPRCSCSSKGCATSCGPDDPVNLTDTFSTFQLSDLLLEGIAFHFEESGWKFVTTTPGGNPLASERETMDYTDLTFEELMRTIAGLYAVCVEIAEAEKVIEFKHVEDCE